MKIQIDTKAQTIQIEESVNLEEFFKMMKKLFPQDEWKGYRLMPVKKIQNWHNPIVIDRQPIIIDRPWTVPYTPYFYGTGFVQTDNTTDEIKQAGTYCLSVNN